MCENYSMCEDLISEHDREQREGALRRDKRKRRIRPVGDMNIAKIGRRGHRSSADHKTAARHRHR